MRIVAWNVHDNLAQKWPELETLRPDVAVLSEVSEHDAVNRPPSIWRGPSPRRGLAVIGFNDFELRIDTDYDPRLEWIIPASAAGSVAISILAVWAMNHRALQVHPDRPLRRQLLQALDVYEPMLRAGRCVIAGDFNNHVRWDKPGNPSNHMDAVTRLDALGFVSAYHTFHAVDQGAETHPTLYWRWDKALPYHIDYIWMPKSWLPALRSVQVGTYDEWVGRKHSDHVPMTAELDDHELGRVLGQAEV